MFPFVNIVREKISKSTQIFAIEKRLPALLRFWFGIHKKQG